MAGEVLAGRFKMDRGDKLRTPEQVRAHLDGLARQADAYFARKHSHCVIDRTPAGYGPTDAQEVGKTTEMRAAKNAILEGETLLRGKLPAAKREAIEKSVLKAKYTLKALSKEQAA